MRYLKKNEFIIINGNDITFSVDVSNPENAGDYFLSIPSLKIYTSAKSLQSIQTEFKASLNSFINYWIKIKGKNEFMNHLKNLGFSPISTNQSLDRDSLSKAGQVSDVEGPKFDSRVTIMSTADELSTFTYATSISSFIHRS